MVALDTAWPWANDAYGLFCLRAYFCAHNLTRARSYIYVVIPQIGIAIRFLLQVKMSWLPALSKGRRCCGPGCWCCELAERAFIKTGGGAGRALVPLPVLSAGRAHRRWCQLAVRTVEAPYAGCAGCVHSCSSQSHVKRSWDSA